MSDNWTEEELRASVDAYVEMHRLEAAGQPFTKKSYYEDLADRFGRTVKSYEYRMQNISYVYSLQGRRWVSGLKPARNVGSNVIQHLEQLIAASEGQQLGSNSREAQEEASSITSKGQEKTAISSGFGDTICQRSRSGCMGPGPSIWPLRML